MVKCKRDKNRISLTFNQRYESGRYQDEETRTRTRSLKRYNGNRKFITEE